MRSGQAATNRDSLPLAQKRQADLLAACGFKCSPAGVHGYAGVSVEMYRPTGERLPAIAPIIGYGGAAYGGKSYGLLVLAAVAAQLWPGVQIAYFRRTYSELDGPGAAVPYAYEVFGDLASPSEGGLEWHWDNGSAFYFRHCQHETDVYSYKSQQIDILLVDEATSFTWVIIDYLLTRNRSTVAHAGFRPFAVLVSNPGGVGHAWYLGLFDLVEHKYGPHETEKHVLNQNGKYSVTYFIPAFIKDNQIGVALDPGYESRLMERDAETARALHDGDWTIFAGQAFPSWIKDRIVCQPFELKDWWPKWRALDYGFDHPFCAGWLAQDPDKGRTYVYRAVNKPGLTDQQQARLILTSTPAEEQIAYTYASPDMWARKNMANVVKTSVDEYKDEGVLLTRADNDRKGGKRKIDRLLVDLPDSRPALQIFEPYYDIFKVMTSLVRDPHDPEDVLKVDGDDPYDMLKYGLTNLKIAPRIPEDDGNPLNRRFGNRR